jgi:long-chain acyl-CoA synthetase
MSIVLSLFRVIDYNVGVENKKDLWEPVNIPDLFLTSAEKFAGKEALKYKVGHHYESLTYFQLKEEVLKLASHLKKIGLGPEDKAILFTENRPEWVVVDLALSMLGVVNVPIHSVLSPVQLGDIIEEIKPKAIFFSNHDLGFKLLEISEKINKIPRLVSFEKLEKISFSHLLYFKDLMDGVSATEKEKAEIIQGALAIKPEDVCTIIYTSGTTGHFKGVQLTHQNFIYDLLAVLRMVKVYPDDRFFSILPLSHVFERNIGYYVPLYSGASIGYAIDLANISTEIKERRPTIIIAVPRLFEKIYEKIIKNASSNALKKNLFQFSFYYQREGSNKLLKKTFEKLIFSKIRNQFGGDLRFFVSGGAALPPKLGEFFSQVGLVILEGYGLTETAPVISCNCLEDYCFGTVGRVLEGVNVKISPKDEILVKGPNVFGGYINKSDNEDSFTKDGWFRTGDYGFLNKRGYLVLTGRKKDLIVLSTGKKVSPAAIEEKLESSPYIDQAFVFGDARKHIGAIIVPNFEELGSHYEGKGKKQLAQDKKVREFLLMEISKVLDSCASYERVRKFIIQSDPFTVENGELTPKLSLRRHIIYERNLDEIEKIYKLA